MLSAVGWALFAAVQPLGIIAFIALLGSRGGRRNTWGFIVGWLLCAGLVAALTMLVASGHRSRAVSSTVGSAGLLQVVLGVAAFAFVLLRRRRRAARPAILEQVGPAENPVEPEKAVGPVGAALIAALLQGWPVVAVAVAAAVDATSAGVARVSAVLLVVVLTGSTYLTAQVLSGVYPQQTAARLDRLKRSIETHRDRVVDLALLGIGVWLVGHGLVVQLAR